MMPPYSLTEICNNMQNMSLPWQKLGEGCVNLCTISRGSITATFENNLLCQELRIVCDSPSFPPTHEITDSRQYLTMPFHLVTTAWGNRMLKKLLEQGNYLKNINRMKNYKINNLIIRTLD
jgi:hypothetical protein